MTVFLSNTYSKEEYATTLLVTGLVGVFEDEAKAVKVWNNILIDFKIPEDRRADYSPEKCFTRKTTVIPVDIEGKYEDDLEKAEFYIELVLKDTEMNKVLERYD